MALCDCSHYMFLVSRQPLISVDLLLISDNCAVHYDFYENTCCKYQELVVDNGMHFDHCVSGELSQVWFARNLLEKEVVLPISWFDFKLLKALVASSAPCFL